MKKILYRALLLAFLIATTARSTRAQLDPFGAQYFANQYLGNSAMAGFYEGARVSVGYRQLWNSIPGGPQQQYLTAEYGFTKVGIGLNLNREVMGLHGRLRTVGSYAYHLPLNNANRLHFGVSLGFTHQRLESAIDADLSDEQINRYNARGLYLDGSFGAAFTTERLNLQVSLPNLKNLWGTADVRVADIPTFYAAASCKFNLNQGNDGVILEPKAAFRGVKGFDHILDAGAQLTLANSQVMLMGMYHSNQTSTFGLGMDYKHRFLINAMYTTQSAALNGYTNGNFEITLRAAFGSKEQ